MTESDSNSGVLSGMPDRLGSCRIVGLLARGGFGWIFRGVQEPDGRPVAVKVLPRELDDGSETAARFHREAQSAARLDHPNIVRIYETGADKGYHYIAMELVEGSNLERYAEARGGKLTEGEAARLILQAAEGLGYAHMRGVFHRDIKPSNLLVTPQGRLKIVDFGLAIIYDISTRLTQTGLCVGTPYFMSPERCQGFRGDARSDIYSLGVTLYVLTTGRMPFDYKEIADILRAHVRAPRPDPWTLNPDLSPAMRNIILRCMAKKPEERPQSAMDLARDLKPLVKTTSIFKISQMQGPRGPDATTVKEIVPDAGRPTSESASDRREKTADASGAENQNTPRPLPRRPTGPIPPPPPPPDWTKRPSSRRTAPPSPPSGGVTGQDGGPKTPSRLRPITDKETESKPGGTGEDKK
jgi:serine/threonine protein kinase